MTLSGVPCTASQNDRDAPRILSALLQERALSGAEPRDRRGRSGSPANQSARAAPVPAPTPTAAAIFFSPVIFSSPHPMTVEQPRRCENQISAP
jgi:hypothetical protein